MIEARVGTDDLFRIANHLIKGLMPKEDVLKYLRMLNSYCCVESLPDSEIIIKVEAALKGKRNWSAETREWVGATKGFFSTTEIQNELRTATKEEKRAINATLQRLSKGEDPLLERHNSKNGYYRLIDKDLQEIDWRNADISKQLNIRYPFGIEKYFVTMPKNLIIIAGDGDSGKSAFCLNFIRLNMKRHPINLFSSEMGDLELQSRLTLFKDHDLDSWNFKALERSSNFADVIRPNEINVIDYMELSEAFYKVGGYFTEIHDKLRDGIAIIALQKEEGATLGRGKDFGKEKPRLYLTINKDYPGAILKMNKVKNWRDPELNPNGYQIRFKILQGVNLLPEGRWDLP